MSDKKIHQLVSVCVTLFFIGAIAMPSLAISEFEKKPQQPTTGTPYTFTAPCFVLAYGPVPPSYLDCTTGYYNFTFSPGFLLIIQFSPPSILFHTSPSFSWTAGQFTGSLACFAGPTFIFFGGVMLTGTITGTSY